MRDDGKLRVLAHDPFCGRTHDSASTLPARHSDPLRLIPNGTPNVALVREHRADRRVAPTASVLVASSTIIRGTDAFLVKEGGDFLQRHTLGKELKDAHHHGGLCFVHDHPFAWVLCVW